MISIFKIYHKKRGKNRVKEYTVVFAAFLDGLALVALVKSGNIVFIMFHDYASFEL